MENLYLGNHANAQDLTQLRHKKDKITHILNIQEHQTPTFEDEGFVYLILSIDDQPAERLLDILSDAIEFISEGMKKGKVLVHCDTGKSRAASAVIAYMMKKGKVLVHCDTGKSRAA